MNIQNIFDGRGLIVWSIRGLHIVFSSFEKRVDARTMEKYEWKVQPVNQQNQGGPPSNLASNSNKYRFSHMLTA